MNASYRKHIVRGSVGMLNSASAENFGGIIGTRNL